MPHFVHYTHVWEQNKIDTASFKNFKTCVASKNFEFKDQNIQDYVRKRPYSKNALITLIDSKLHRAFIEDTRTRVELDIEERDSKQATGKSVGIDRWIRGKCIAHIQWYICFRLRKA